MTIYVQDQPVINNDKEWVGAIINNADNCNRSINAGTGLTGGGVLNSNRTLNVNFGTASGTVCQGNDSRLSNSRKCNNTFDNAATSRSNLGLSDAAITTVASIRSGTTKDNVGLSSVDNFSRAHYDGRYLGKSAIAIGAYKTQPISGQSAKYTYATTPDGLTLFEIPNNAIAQGTTFGAMLSVNVNAYRGFQLAGDKPGKLFIRGIDGAATDGFSNWHEVYSTLNKPSKSDVGLSNVDNYNRAHYDGRYLGKSAKAADADKLDGINSSGFVQTTNNSTLNSDNVNTRGITKLYRSDGDSDYYIKTHWEGSKWWLKGYSGTSFHAECKVGNAAYADSSGTSSSVSGATDSATGNTVMKRNSSGDVWCRLFRSSYSSTNSNIAAIYTTQTIGGDYMRPSTPDQVKAAMNLNNARNISISSSNPSGGSNGDIWMKY